MRRDPRHDILFEPIRIGPKTLRNRFYQVPHCTGLRHREAAARRPRYRGDEGGGRLGRGLHRVLRRSAPTPTSRRTSRRSCWDDDDLRAPGAHVRARPTSTARSPASSSTTRASTAPRRAVPRWPGDRPLAARERLPPLVVPKAMETRRHPPRPGATGSRRRGAARDAGFDIVYVYGAPQLPADAVPLALLQQAHRRVRRLAREPRALLARDPRGRARGRRRRLRDRRRGSRVDALGAVRASSSTRRSRSSGSPTTSSTSGTSTSARSLEWSKDSGASRFFAEGYQLEWTGRVREATAKPIVGVGAAARTRTRWPRSSRAGVWDMIGAARPSIADPFLPRKIEEGRYDEIRECIGCNVCIPKSDPGGNIGCTQNATAGEEYRRGWHPERFERAANARPGRPRRRRRARPGWSARSSSASAASAASTSSTPSAEIGGIMRWIPQLPGPAASGRASLNWRRIQLDEAAERRGAHAALRLDAEASASTAPRSSSARPARAGRATG